MMPNYIPLVLRKQICSAVITGCEEATLTLDFPSNASRRQFIQLIVAADINNNKIKFWLSNHNGYAESDVEIHASEEDMDYPSYEQDFEPVISYRLKFTYSTDKGIGYAKAVYNAIAKGT